MKLRPEIIVPPAASCGRPLWRRFIQVAPVALLLISLTLSACASSPARYSGENRVELYGRHSCPLCQRMVQRLEERALAFRFYDIDESESQLVAMWELVRKTDPARESVSLPVMLVNGAVLISPEWSAVEEKLLRKEAPVEATEEGDGPLL